MSHGALAAALFLGIAPGTSAPARAAAKGKAGGACVVAYKNAQQLEKSAQLRLAHETLRGCVKASCGALRQKCMAQYAMLESDIPSVIPVVTDSAGAPRTDVQVTMDGELLTSQLDGRALPIDPGLHTFVFSAEASVFATTKIMIAQGEHNRAISVSMRSPDKRGASIAAAGRSVATGGATTDEPPPPAEPAPAPKKAPRPSSTEAAYAEPAPTVASHGSSVAPYVLGGIGLAGLGAYGMFTYWGKKDNERLSECAPNCRPESLDHIRKLYLVADISLGVGIVGLGAATWVALSAGSSKEKTPSESAYVVDVQPAPNGAYATVSGSF